VYCPWCGQEMSLRDGALTCVAGGMTLSEQLQAVLTERFPVAHAAPAGPATKQSEGCWHCPGCGSRLSAEMSCESCRQSIHDQLFTLIELHPHAHG
jgi:hypothetical protein